MKNIRNLKLLTAASIFCVAPAFAAGINTSVDKSVEEKSDARTTLRQNKEVDESNRGSSFTVNQSFDFIDINNNQVIEGIELSSIKNAGVKTEDILISYDQDSSGDIDRDEYAIIMRDSTMGASAQSKAQRDVNAQPENKSRELSEAMPKRTTTEQPVQHKDVPAEADRVIASGTSVTVNQLEAPAHNQDKPVVTLDNRDAERLEAQQNAGDREPSQVTIALPSDTAPAEITVAQNVYTAPLDAIQNKSVQGESGENVGSVETILVKNDGSDAALLIVNDRGEERLTPVKDVRMNGDVLVLLSSSQPDKNINKSSYREIDNNKKNIKSAMTVLNVSVR